MDGRWVTINGTHIFIENGKITKGPNNLVGEYVGNITYKFNMKNLPSDKDLGIDNDSYVNDEDYKILNSIYKDLVSKESKLQEDLNEEYSKGIIDEDFSIFGLSLLKPTEKVKEIREEIKSTQNRIDSVVERIKDYERVHRKPYITDEFKDVTEESFRYFTKDTNINYYSTDNGFKVVEMTPKQYIQMCAKAHNSTYENEIYSCDRNKISFYSSLMSQGSKAPLPYVVTTYGEQEGRHRALAAMLLGADKIPVLVES